MTTNSATLVNKGLEVIEAHLLFDIPFDRITVVVHPQSVIHSMVEFVDGSTLAQASPPDMRLPIALGMAWPDRVPCATAPCDWTKAATWEFFPLDDEAFPAVALARRVGSAGGTMPAVYNAANEVCVDAFHDGRIRFTEIVDTIARVVDDHEHGPAAQVGRAGPGIAAPALDVESVLRVDQWARARARGAGVLEPVAKRPPLAGGERAQIPGDRRAPILARRGHRNPFRSAPEVDLDAVVAPIGGGGLISGIAIAIKALTPGISVFGAEPEGADDAARSKAARELVPQLKPNTIADGLLAGLGRHTWPVIRDEVDRVITVPDDAIVAAMRLMFERMKLVVEPSGAVSAAARPSGGGRPWRAGAGAGPGAAGGGGGGV